MNGDLTFYIVLAVVGLGTFLIRLSFLQFLAGRQLSDQLRLLFSFIPAATLSAIVFPAVLNSGGSMNITPENHRLIAILVAVLVAWKTRSTLAVLGAGMATLWLLDGLLPL